MAEEIAFVSDDEIKKAADDLWKAAVYVKGRQELRYAPYGRPKEVYNGYGGKDSEMYRDAPFRIGPDKKYLGTADDWAQLNSQYSWIPDAFAQRIGPDPRQIEALKDPLLSVSGKLFFPTTAKQGDIPPASIGPIGQLMKKADSSVTGWTGDAAAKFKHNFLDPLPEAAQAQSYLAVALAQAIVGNRDMFLGLRHDLLVIAQQGAIAVGRAGECQLPHISDETKAKLALAGAVATVAAGVASIPVGGGAVFLPYGVALFTVIAGTSSGLSVTGLGKKEEVKLDADTVDGVLGKIVDALIGTDKTLTAKEDDMISALQKMIGMITGPAATAYMPPKPELLGYTDDQLKNETSFG